MKSIKKKIKVVDERVKRLRQLSRTINSFSQYEVSQDAKDIAERNLQVTLEACLDIAKMIVSLEGLQEPKDHKELFVVLAQAGIVSQKSLAFLIPMAGTRNILVHSYDKIDDTIMYGILKKHLDDFLMFLTEIRDNYLTRKPEEEQKEL